MTNISGVLDAVLAVGYEDKDEKIGEPTIWTIEGTTVG